MQFLAEPASSEEMLLAHPEPTTPKASAFRKNLSFVAPPVEKKSVDSVNTLTQAAGIKENESITKEDSSATTNDKKSYVGDLYFKEDEKEKYETLEFDSPFDVVSFYNKAIASGTVTLYPWQLEVNDGLSCKDSAKPSQQNPYRFCLCACNGSGKDAFVIAPFVIWFALSKKQSRCIITSASGNQLSSQTENYIANLCRSVNEFHGEEIFKIRQRYIRCLKSGSEIRLFATDEEGKAEGYHPIEPNCSMAIIVNEAKNVAPEIYRALGRCTGFDYWLDISSPGEPNGDFYEHFEDWEHSRHVSTFECAHLPESERLQDLKKYGEHSSYYRSKHLALFTNLEGECIIPLDVIKRAREYSKSGYINKNSNGQSRIGIDLAAGGDENSCVEIKGNCIIRRYNFREKDTTITVACIDRWLREECKADYAHPHIYADDGGVGKVILDFLVDKGWNIARILNQSPSSDRKRYINRGAENWYRVKRIIEENCFYFSPDIEDDLFYKQLYTRYYKQQSTQGRIALESKKDAKAHGRPSPDRADAFILALTGLSVEDFLKPSIPVGASIDDNRPKAISQGKGMKTVEEIMAHHDEQMYKEYEQNVGKMNRVGSLFGNINSRFRVSNRV